MKRLVMVLIVIFAVFFSLFAQEWQIVKEGQLGYGAYDGPNACFFINTNTGWIAGDDGRIQKTNDGGATWITVQEAGDDLADLFAVEFADEDTGYACGADGYIYKSTNGGEVWNMVADADSFSMDLADLCIVNDGLIFFCGDDSTLLKTTDGGNSYAVVNCGFAAEDLDGGIDFCNDSVGVIISDDKAGNTWYTYDGGNNWTYVNIAGYFPMGASSSRLYDIAAVGDSTIFITGYHCVNLVSKDGGQTYALIGDNTIATLYQKCISVVNSDIYFAGRQNGQIIKTLDGGASWDTLYTGSGQKVCCMQFLDENTGFVFSEYGEWFKTSDGGINWTPLIDWPMVNFVSLALPGEQSIITGAWGCGEISNSLDNGISWTYPNNFTNGNFTGDISRLEFCDDNVGFFGSDDGMLAKTTDSGNNWIFIDSPTEENITALFSLNATTLFLGDAKGHIFISTNTGDSWDEIPNDGSEDIFDIWAFSENHAYATADEGEIYYLDPDSSGFTTKFDIGSLDMNAVDFYDDAGLVAADDGLIFRISGGLIDTVFADSNETDIIDVKFMDDTLAYGVGDDGYIVKSTDTGFSWALDTIITRNKLNKLQRRDLIIWAVGNNGTILTYVLPDTDVVVIENPQQPNLPLVYHLEQNYPNPFNPTTTISFSIPVAADVKLSVYNILGREIVNLCERPLEQGYYKFDFDASSLSSGIYFYMIEAGDFTKIMKMTLLK